MKNLIALIALLIASACFAQQPPLPTCITNVILSLTDTNSYFDNGGGSTNLGGGTVITVNINYHGCNTTNVVIGNVFVQCDSSRFCQNNENIYSCPTGGIFPITLPALCDGITATFQPDGGCCSIGQVNSNPQACIPPDGSQQP